MADFAIEAALWRKGYRLVAGVDEAGRGPLAGPLVVAAVILPPDWHPPEKLDDSKRLTPAQREAAYGAIRTGSLGWRVVVVSPREVDRVNVLNATLNGMARALAQIKPAPDFALVDGNRLPKLNVPAEALVKGDGRSCTVAAASIVAKVVRDRLIAVYGRRYPQWGFERHKGYPTLEHRRALALHGASPIHRRTFRVKPLDATGTATDVRAWPTGKRSGPEARQLPPGISNG